MVQILLYGFVGCVKGLCRDMLERLNRVVQGVLELLEGFIWLYFIGFYGA